VSGIKEMVTCTAEDVKFLFDMEVPANSRMCLDCFNNVQKYHDFKKKVVEKQHLQKLKVKEDAPGFTTNEENDTGKCKFKIHIPFKYLKVACKATESFIKVMCIQ
jgi:hypothetical protein